MAQRQTYYTQPALGPTATPSGISPPVPPAVNGAALVASLQADRIEFQATKLRHWLNRCSAGKFMIAVSLNRFSVHTLEGEINHIFECLAVDEFGPEWWLRAVDTLQKVLCRCLQGPSVAELSVTRDFWAAAAADDSPAEMDKWPAMELLVVHGGDGVDYVYNANAFAKLYFRNKCDPLRLRL